MWDEDEQAVVYDHRSDVEVDLLGTDDVKVSVLIVEVTGTRMVGLGVSVEDATTGEEIKILGMSEEEMSKFQFVCNVHVYA